MTVGSAAAVIAAAYLAGFFFLWSIHDNPRHATPLTALTYGYYYGEREDVRRHLLGASAFSFAIVLLSSGALFLPRRRALHGDARFATRGEIRRAGLLGRHGIILGRTG